MNEPLNPRWEQIRDEFMAILDLTQRGYLDPHGADYFRLGVFLLEMIELCVREAVEVVQTRNHPALLAIVDPERNGDVDSEV